MSVVRTVLGDVPPDRLGRVDAHDHLLILGGPAVDCDPDLRIDDRDEATSEAAAFATAGGGTIVDAMPSACGRDAEGLAEVSRRSGVHIIATAGFHTEDYYVNLHWARRYPVDLLAKVIEDECLVGIDRWDGAGPITDRLPIRPGVLKCAFGLEAITATQERGARAVARVQRATGLPLLVHLERGNGGHRALDLLGDEGVPVDAIALSHADRIPDLGYHVELLARGCSLVYDGLGRERYRPASAVVDLIERLARRGVADHLLLGGDLARRSVRRAAGGMGIAGLLTNFVPRIRAALGDGMVDRLLVTNPARFLTIVPPLTRGDP